jgi:hypothetical protein
MFLKEKFLENQLINIVSKKGMKKSEQHGSYFKNKMCNLKPFNQNQTTIATKLQAQV